MRRQHILILICCLAVPAHLPAAELAGRVVDAIDSTGLTGATVLLLGTPYGGHTGEGGRFHLTDLPEGRFDVFISFIGYRGLKVTGVELSDSTATPRLLALQPTQLYMPELVVSASRRPQTFSEAAISMSVVEAGRLADYNTFTISGPLRYLPGVTQVGGQINIRGSSGYSRGTGSRVLLLVDGVPQMSADTGDIKWDSIPVEEVERVEVIKGAGSALYGTGALGGVINVMMRQPSEVPLTRFRAVSGFYSQPAHGSWRWRDQPMYVAGVDASHSRTVRRTGVLFSAGHKRTTGYRENDEYSRYHLYAKAVHDVGPRTRWTGVTSWAVDDHDVFVQWRDRSHPLEVAGGDRAAATVSSKLSLSSQLSHLYSPTLGLKLRGFYYLTDFDNTEAAGGLASVGHKIGSEILADYRGWRGTALSTGLSGTFDLARSPADFLGSRDVLNLALYSQALIDAHRTAQLSLGLRYDLHRRSSGSDSGAGHSLCLHSAADAVARVEHQLSPLLGGSLALGEHTTVRASIGRGFRAPSILEIHAQANASGILLCPNPALGSERSWSYEIGVKRRLGDRMAVDAALFWNSYDGLVEGRPEPNLVGATPVASFRNISKARVRGAEVEHRAALPMGFQWRGAYTFLDAVEFLDEDDVLSPYCQDELVPGDEAPLPYRARHSATASLSAGRGATAGGLSFRFASQFERVSGLFPECRRDLVPVYLLDAHIERRVGPLRFNLRIDNVLQYHYVLTERSLRPPRLLSLSVSGSM